MNLLTTYLIGYYLGQFVAGAFFGGFIPMIMLIVKRRTSLGVLLLFCCGFLSFIHPLVSIILGLIILIISFFIPERASGKLQQNDVKENESISIVRNRIRIIAAIMFLLLSVISIIYMIIQQNSMLSSSNDLLYLAVTIYVPLFISLYMFQFKLKRAPLLLYIGLGIELFYNIRLIVNTISISINLNNELNSWYYLYNCWEWHVAKPLINNIIYIVIIIISILFIIQRKKGAFTMHKTTTVFCAIGMGLLALCLLNSVVFHIIYHTPDIIYKIYEIIETWLNYFGYMLVISVFWLFSYAKQENATLKLKK